MTGGVVRRAGPIGRNFAAGMSGGIGVPAGRGRACAPTLNNDDSVGARRRRRRSTRCCARCWSATQRLTGSAVARARCWPAGTTWPRRSSRCCRTTCGAARRLAQERRLAVAGDRPARLPADPAPRRALPPGRRAPAPTAATSTAAADEGARARAGAAVHGLRRAVLPHRLPARQPDPRLERPRATAAAGARRIDQLARRRTTSRSSPASSAPRRARRRACWRSTTTR